MGYSNNKWRKILTILMIINLCFILFARFTRVFGVVSDSYFTNTYNLSKNESDFNIGQYHVYLPDFIYDYDNIFFTTYKPNNYTFALLIFSNNKIFIDGSSGAVKGELNKDYYYMTFYQNTYKFDMSSYNLSDFSHVNDKYQSSVTWAGYLVHDSYNALYGSLYDFASGDMIVENEPYNAPYFENVTEIEKGYPDGIFISPQDYGIDDNLYFHLLSVNQEAVSTPGNSVFYYSDNIFELNKNSEYYRFFEEDVKKQYAYYYIPRYKLSFNLDTSYVYVLSSSPEVINNSYNHIEEDITKGVYDVIESDTTGVMTATDLESDRLNRIEQENINQANNTNSINNSLTNTTPDDNTGVDIDNSLNFDNSNEGLSNLNNGFFSRLTSMLSNLLGYNLGDDTSVSIPLPNSDKSLVLHSKVIYDNIIGALRLIINAFWVYIFSFYMWKFINKIYIAVSTGHILDTFSSSGEAITNDML